MMLRRWLPIVVLAVIAVVLGVTSASQPLWLVAVAWALWGIAVGLRASQMIKPARRAN